MLIILIIYTKIIFKNQRKDYSYKYIWEIYYFTCFIADHNVFSNLKYQHDQEKNSEILKYLRQKSCNCLFLKRIGSLHLHTNKINLNKVKQKCV